jgi:hypothetical protein
MVGVANLLPGAAGSETKREHFILILRRLVA